MALVAKTLTLDITPGAIPQVVNVSEYDENREYTVTLIDEGGTYEIPSGTTATIEGTIGGNGFSEAATVSGNDITFTLTENMTAKAGDVWTKIKLTNSGKPIQTAAFILRCDKAGVEADTLINAPGFDAQLQDAVDVWMESQDGIGEAVQEATEAYAQAHGLTPGVATVNGRGGDVTITAEELGAVTDVSDKADKTEVDLALAQKQNALTAGENITIEDDTISAEVDAETIAADVTSWLAANVNPTGSAVVVDSSLTVSGAAADAAVTGNLKSALLMDFSKVPTVQNNEDFDDYKTAGSYKVTSYAVAKTVSNIPEKIGGRLIVLPTMAAARILQIYIPAAEVVRIYVRAYYDSWSSWAQLQTSDEIQLALAYAGATEIPSGSDFDGYKTPGNYFVSSGTAAGNIANCPASVAGRLTVMETHGAERVKQVYELSREDGATYTRYYNGTSWGEWTLEKGESLLSYWDSAITTAADAINNQRTVAINGTDYTINSGLSGDRFVFVTDSHWTWGAKHTPQIIQKLLKEVGGMKIFHGGDIVDGALSGVGESATDAEKQVRQSWYKRLLCESKAALEEYDPMYFCIGNHEYFNPDQAAAFVDWQLTYDEVYRSVVSGMNEQIIDHDALGDYCFDNSANRIRYFFIASNPAAQIAAGSATWLASALEEMPEGYTAIVVSHVALNTVINEDSISEHYGEVVPLSTFNKIVTVLEAAKAKGIDIGFVISGHTHVDRYCYTGGGILIVTTATDAYRKTKEGWAEDGSTREGYNTMTPGTATEHCFDVVSFDTANRVVALTRIGAGTSRAFTF